MTHRVIDKFHFSVPFWIWDTQILDNCIMYTSRQGSQREHDCNECDTGRPNARHGGWAEIVLFRTSHSMLRIVGLKSYHSVIYHVPGQLSTALMILVVSSPIITTSAQGAGDSVIINEIYVSPNSEVRG